MTATNSAPRVQQFPADLAPKRASHRDDRRVEMVRRVTESDLWQDDRERRTAAFLAQSVVRRADDDFLNRHPAEALPGHVRSAMHAVSDRPDDAIKVGVLLPEQQRHGYSLPMAVLETCMGDQPFIVDTIKMVLRRMDIRILGTMNMILPVERDEQGKMLAIENDNAKAKNTLGWQPRYDLARLIDAAYDYRRAAEDQRKVWYPG